MAKKLEVNKKTLRVLSAQEMEAVAGGLDQEPTDLKTICTVVSSTTMQAPLVAPAPTSPTDTPDGTP